MTQRVRDVVNRILQSNGFFAHPENIVISMLMEEQENVRELALRRILKCGSNSSMERRKFVVPKVLFDAEHDYVRLSIDRLASYYNQRTSCNSFCFKYHHRKLERTANAAFGIFPKFPCHTQAIERAVKLVTEASACVVDSSERDSYIIAKLQSRKKMPQFTTKKDFVV